MAQNKTEKKVPVIVDGVHGCSAPETYVPPKEPAVQEHLKWFRGLKLGLMMHWSPGSQMGSFESWPLCDEAGEWSQADFRWTDPEEAKQQYENMNKTFNPVKFRPDKWAKLARECGFKYLLFTTKHHDGFCMFDTDTTNYKVTAEDCPFHTHKYADIVGNLYEAFRNEGLAISVYFSKPDWHSEYYWAPQFGEHKSGAANYDAKEHPEVWEKFVQYTHRQIEELTSKYGKVDVLWLDGGVVRPDNKHMDIRLGEVVERIRATTQPHLIVCDRTVGGEYENIITPEQSIPSAMIPVPWESCLTVGGCFSFHYTDHPKSARELVHTLIDVVAKGGNLALNITPQPDGELPAPAVESLLGLGEWLQVNGEGIYETEVCAPYVSTARQGLAYTQKNGNVYVFYRYQERQHYRLPRYLFLEIEKPAVKITLLRNGQELAFVQENGRVKIDTEQISMLGVKYSDCFKVEFDLAAQAGNGGGQ